MPEKPLTIATYAAGASLAAITLVYVFGPTYFLDDEAANSSRSSRKKGVVGLHNPANDCFINSVLQALAGLPELRLYLIREMHRRNLDGPQMYKGPSVALEEIAKNMTSKQLPEWKLLGLQQGLVTAGLKDVLDALNERPIAKKTISAQGFVKVVEEAFRTRLSRQQQDAQEFLQVVTERLADEYYAGRRVRREARRKHELRSRTGSVPSLQLPNGTDDLEKSGETIKPRRPADPEVTSSESASNAEIDDTASVVEETERVDSGKDVELTRTTLMDSDEQGGDELPGFPFEGKLESYIECSRCHFKPKPAVSSFVTLTLNVPQEINSTSLNACFDGMLKVEHIDDYRCDRCTLEHALQVNAKQLAKTRLPRDQRTTLERDRAKMEQALSEDPEKPPEDVKLPDSSTAPKRRIAKHMRVSSFPGILAIHLNRSMWDRSSSSSKNMAKVSFPESLPLGGLLDRMNYRLLGIITHKGGHHSGHYETFRRQFLNPPFSTSVSMGTEGIYSLRNSPAPSQRPSVAPSPRLSGRSSKEVGTAESSLLMPDAPVLSTPSLLSPSSSSASSRSLQIANHDRWKAPSTSIPLDAIPTLGLPTPPRAAQNADTGRAESMPKRALGMNGAMNIAKSRRKKPQDRWWRISDDKIKESKTSQVLDMQREVYLLFYEMVDDAHA